MRERTVDECVESGGDIFGVLRGWVHRHPRKGLRAVEHLEVFSNCCLLTVVFVEYVERPWWWRGQSAAFHVLPFADRRLVGIPGLVYGGKHRDVVIFRSSSPRFAFLLDPPS